MGLDEFSRTKAKKVESLPSNTAFESTEREDFDPWMTAGAISKKINMGPGWVQSMAESYREDHPEWFSRHRSNRGVEYEHYSRELTKILAAEAGKRETAPTDWKTTGMISRETGLNSNTVAKRVNEYRTSHPDWFKKYIAANKRLEEYFAPELTKILSDEFAQHTPPPEGWDTASSIAEQLNVDYGTVLKFAEKIGTPKDETLKEYRTSSGKIALHMSPAAIKGGFVDVR